MKCYDNRSSVRHIYGTLFDNTGQPIFLKLRPEIKVTVAAKLYTLYVQHSVTPRCVHKPNYQII